jgi:hypothetical protein
MTSLATVEDHTELTQALGETEARELTERFRAQWNVIKAPLQAFSALMAEAEAGRPWEALGYGTGEAGRGRWLREEFDIGRAQYFRRLKAAGDEARLSEAAGAPLRIREAHVRGMSDVQIEAVAAKVREDMVKPGAVAPEVVQEALAEARAASPLAKPRARRYGEETVDAEVISDPNIPDDEPDPAASMTRAAPKGYRVTDETAAQLGDALDRLAGVGGNPEGMARALTAKQANLVLPSLEVAFDWLSRFYDARNSVVSR